MLVKVEFTFGLLGMTIENIKKTFYLWQIDPHWPPEATIEKEKLHKGKTLCTLLHLYVYGNCMGTASNETAIKFYVVKHLINCWCLLCVASMPLKMHCMSSDTAFIRFLSFYLYFFFLLPRDYVGTDSLLGVARK